MTAMSRKFSLFSELGEHGKGNIPKTDIKVLKGCQIDAQAVCPLPR